jgi:tocopherol O-methyltransferase
MIVPKKLQVCDGVALHYDELDPFYRKIWGSHLHHGLWVSGKESVEEAVLNLVKLVAKSAEIRPGSLVCDIGSGYGETSRCLAKDWGANVTAITLSKAQYEYAKGVDLLPSPTYLLGDWLANTLPTGNFDAVFSIESSEHMENKERFFKEAFRVLKPNGKLVVCAWLSKINPRKVEIDYLLEPICREGRLPSMGTAEEYTQWMEEAGFRNVRFTDLSEQVKKTWTICACRSLKAIITDSSFRKFLRNSPSTNKVFLKTVFRIWLAYQLGSMRYGILTANR